MQQILYKTDNRNTDPERRVRKCYCFKTNKQKKKTTKTAFKQVHTHTHPDMSGQVMRPEHA